MNRHKNLYANITLYAILRINFMENCQFSFSSLQIYYFPSLVIGYWFNYNYNNDDNDGAICR